MIKSKRMRWRGHVARMGKKRNAYRVLVESQRGRDQQDGGGRIILRWILEK
jgi:hypothetical protein